MTDAEATARAAAGTAEGPSVSAEGLAGRDAEREAALSVLDEATVGYLAMTTPDGPYVVPLSFAQDGRFVYWHGGVGVKSEALSATGKACLAASITGELNRGETPCADSFDFRSAVVSGPVSLLTDGREKEAGLRRILAKYEAARANDSLPAEALMRTLVYAMEMATVSYKQRNRT